MIQLGSRIDNINFNVFAGADIKIEAVAECIPHPASLVRKVEHLTNPIEAEYFLCNIIFLISPISFYIRVCAACAFLMDGGNLFPCEFSVNDLNYLSFSLQYCDLHWVFP